VLWLAMHEFFQALNVMNGMVENILAITKLTYLVLNGCYTHAQSMHQKKYVWLQHRNQMSVVEISGIQIYVTTEQKTIWTCVEWSMYHQT
jgi:hypothetical protein